MKQLLSLALALIPCLAWAQYPSNGNQKITLGEQTTADGLIWRGVAADTTLTAKSDTAAYFVLDTANLNLYTYKASAIGKKWIQLGSDTTSLNLVSRFAAKLNISDTASMLTPYFRKLDTTNIKYVNTYGTQTVNGAKTFSSTVTATRFDPTSSSASGNGMFLPAENTLGFSTSGTNKMTILSGGNVGIGTTSPNNLLALYSASSAIYTQWVQSGTGTSATDGLRIGLDASSNGIIDLNEGTNLITSVNGSERMRITSGGNVGIGTTPSVQFHTTGGVRFANFGAGTATFDASGNISSSDSRLKKQDFAYKVEGLKEIMKLKPVAFKLLTDINERGNLSETQIGFFADDVAQIIPSASFLGNDGYYNYLDRGILAALVKAVQEQQEIIEGLKTRILTLENK